MAVFFRQPSSQDPIIRMRARQGSSWNHQDAQTIFGLIAPPTNRIFSAAAGSINPHSPHLAYNVARVSGEGEDDGLAGLKNMVGGSN